MNFFALSALINGVTASIFGFFGYFKNRKSKLHQIFWVMNLSVAWWSFCYYFWQISINIQQALFWTRALTFGSILIPVLHFHWILILLKKEEENKKLLILSYLITGIFLILNFTPLLVNRVEPEPPFPYWPRAGILYPFYLIFLYFSLLAYAVFLLIKSFKKEVGHKKDQIKYLIAGGLISFISGAFNFPLWFGIRILPYPNVLVSLYVLIFTYAIVRHRLMDIRIVVRQVTVYGVSLIVSVAFCLIGLILIIKYVLPFIPFSSSLIWLMLAISILGIIVFQFVKEKFSQFANRYLFYPLYSFEKTLENLSKKLSRFINLNHLIFLTTDTLKEVFKLDNIALILRKLEPPKGQLKFLGIADKRKFGTDLGGEDEFYLVKNIGFKNEEVSPLIKNKFLLHYLEKDKKPLILDELEALADEVKDEYLKKKFLAIKKLMEKMRAVLYLPLLIEDRLIGVFILGKKVSGDAYSTQDLHLLETLSSQIAIAVNNAQLYEQVQIFNQILRARIIEATKELSEAYRELKKLDESKTEFLSLASHQLRTPLSAMKGYLSMILEGDYGKLQEETKEAVESVYQSNERLIALINDLLNVTRIEAGRLEYSPVPSDLGKLIKEVIAELKLAAEKKNLKIEYLAEKLPEFSFDPNKIREVLINLIDNAIKYTEKGGIIIKAKLEKKEVRVEVSDTGIGIPPEKMNSLFQWFSRGRGAYRLDAGGFGLGLYIAKKILEKAGGKIWAESEGEGRGSTFIFTLPIK